MTRKVKLFVMSDHDNTDNDDDRGPGLRRSSRDAKPTRALWQGRPRILKVRRSTPVIPQPSTRFHPETSSSGSLTGYQSNVNRKLKRKKVIKIQHPISFREGIKMHFCNCPSDYLLPICNPLGEADRMTNIP